MMPGQGLTQEQMQGIQQTTKNISAVIRKDLENLTFSIELIPTNDDEGVRAAAANLIELMAKQLGEQLTVFFGIQGKMVNVKHVGSY